MVDSLGQSLKYDGLCEGSRSDGTQVDLVARCWKPEVPHTAPSMEGITMTPTKGKAPAPTKTQGASPNQTDFGADYPLIFTPTQDRFDTRELQALEVP